jgi:uncharacterized protein
MIQGVGIGLRKELFEPLRTTTRRIDWLEIVSENYLGATGRAEAMLVRFADRWPIIPHGVGLSVGSEPLPGYLAGLVALVRTLAPPYFSDHLCYSSIGARSFLDLLPLPRHAEAVARVVRNAGAAMAATGTPLILENITTYAEMPGSTLDEATFLAQVAERAGVGLLLDVNNLYINAVNHGRQPRDLLDAFPLHHVKQLHLAGHTRDGDLLLDTHAAPVAPAVWDLYVEVLKRCGPVPTLVEWDQHIPSLDAVLDEADHARDLMERHA